MPVCLQHSNISQEQPLGPACASAMVTVLELFFRGIRSADLSLKTFTHSLDNRGGISELSPLAV